MFKPWSSLVKGESLACQINSPFNNKLLVFVNKIEKIALPKHLSFCLMGKLSGKPVTSLYLQSCSVSTCLAQEVWSGWGGGVSPELFCHSIDELVVLLKTLISRHPSEFG